MAWIFSIAYHLKLFVVIEITFQIKDWVKFVRFSGDFSVFFWRRSFLKFFLLTCIFFNVQIDEEGGGQTLPPHPRPKRIPVSSRYWPCQCMWLLVNIHFKRQFTPTQSSTCTLRCATHPQHAARLGQLLQGEGSINIVAWLLTEFVGLVFCES